MNITGGTLNIGPSNFIATGLAGSGTVGNGSAITRWLFVNNSVDKTFSGTLQNGAGVGLLGLNKGGAGTPTLTGASTYSDITTLTAGTLVAASA